MELCDVREYVKRILPEAEHFYIGRMDASQEKCIGIYDGKPIPKRPCIGIKTYDELSVSILVHWTGNARETGTMARLLYDRLEAADFPEIGGHIVPLISLQTTAPMDCTRPESPVFEQIIEAVLIYNL